LSALAGLFSARDAGDLAPRIAAMRRAQAHRGAEESDQLALSWAALGVARFAWETAPEYSGAARVHRDGDLLVVADASIYYRDDLRRALRSRGIACDHDDPAALILAAYRAFGAACVTQLEGDFAFIVVDDAKRLVTLGRDHVGRRPLHYAEQGGMLLVASAARAIGRDALIGQP